MNERCYLDSRWHAYGGPSPVRTDVTPMRKEKVVKEVGGAHPTGFTLTELRALVEETAHRPGDSVVFVRPGWTQEASERFGVNRPTRAPLMTITWES